MVEIKERKRIPIYKKLCLSIEEAAEYSGIGEARLREMVKDPTCDFVLRKGTQTLVKRMKFESFINETEVI